MAQNFLYAFEFMVDEVLITWPSYCISGEDSTCCEISFRSSVFVPFDESEYGRRATGPKCGKRCLFSLESPVTDDDCLTIRVYRTKSSVYKSLLGTGELSLKSFFDNVTESFHIENPFWRERVTEYSEQMPEPWDPNKTANARNESDICWLDRNEQHSSTSEVTKRLLPLFNREGLRTGTVALVMRVVCKGPAIVSSFPFRPSATGDQKVDDANFANDILSSLKNAMKEWQPEPLNEDELQETKISSLKNCVFGQVDGVWQ